MATQNQRRENSAFSSCPTTRATLAQDDFLQSNKYLIDSTASAPKGGACRGEDTSLWFPVSKNGAYSRHDVEKQKKGIEICRGCAVRAECLMYSLEHEPVGIWGGFPETARSLLAHFWKITNKRNWTVKASFIRYRQVSDYIVNEQDISFIRKLARDNNLAQPPTFERSGLSATAKRRISLGLADTTS
jgi:hypothetical protein